MAKKHHYTGEGLMLYNAVFESGLSITDTIKKLKISRGSLYNYYESEVVPEDVKVQMASILKKNKDVIFNPKLNGENKNGNKSIGNVPDKSLFSYSNFQKHIVETLPMQEDANGWFPFMDNVTTLKSAIYSNQIKDKHTMLMESKTENLYRIPDIPSDFSFEMFSENMMPKYKPSNRISASFIEKNAIWFGYAYYIVYHNKKLPPSVNYIRKHSNRECWILDNEDKINFDPREVNIGDIHSIWMITGKLEKTTE